MLSGDKYEREANDNQLREIKVQAPRGEIVDRDGRVLVENRTGYAVKITPDKLPEDEAERQRLYRGLGRVLGLKPARIERNVERQLKALPFSTAVVKSDVSDEVLAYLLERQDEFPGVDARAPVPAPLPARARSAPTCSATSSEVNEEQLKDERYRGVELGDRVGQSGIEYQYDRFLRGKNGATRLQVDALGELRQEPGRSGSRSRGASCGCRSTSTCSRPARRRSRAAPARARSWSMDVRNGEVLALGS